MGTHANDQVGKWAARRVADPEQRIRVIKMNASGAVVNVTIYANWAVSEPGTAVVQKKIVH